MSESKRTTDHETIRHWVEAHGGHPASVVGTAKGHEAGLLRIDFDANGRDDSLEEISWDEFFDKFEEKHLAFLYQDETASGKPSTFSKLVSR